MDFSSVDQARQSADQAQQTATDFTAGGYTLADQLRQAIGSRFGESGVAQEAGTVQANLLANPAQARNHILDLIHAGTILSPTQQNAITASSNAAALAPVIGNNILQQAQFGTLQDLIDAGTNAWNAQTTRAQGAATLAQNNYKDLLNELVTKQTLQQNEAMNPLDIAYKQALINQANKSASGGSTSYDLKTIGDKVYNYDPKTGKLIEVKGVNAGKYSETDVANFANAVANGTMTITNVPQDIRGQVDQLSTQIKSSKPSLLSNIGNWLSGLFK